MIYAILNCLKKELFCHLTVSKQMADVLLIVCDT